MFNLNGLFSKLWAFHFVMCFVTDCQRGSLLGSKTLGFKCIRTTICNVLANYDQNIESRFRLLRVCLFVKLELSDCRIYWTKSARLDQSNLMQIVFSAKFPTQPKPIWCVGFFFSKYKRKKPSHVLEVVDMLCVWIFCEI